MTNKKDLLSIRREIDSLDLQILSLLNSRGLLAEKAGKIKTGQNKYKPEREMEIYKKIKNQNKGPLLDQQVINIFKEIISSCRAIEDELEISFLGPEGTYSDSATKDHFGSSIKKRPTESIEEVFELVDVGKTNYGIVPIENSTEGSVNSTLDCLNSFNCMICGEIEMKIHHSLMGSNRALPKDGYEIHAHAQTLAQCKLWLDSHCPNVKRVAVSSNAKAALDAVNSKKILAIAGSLAAEKYGLEIIQDNIEDYSSNTTRFISIGKEEITATGNDKTSIVVTTKNERGALYHVLKPIQANNLNLAHITYRPSKSNKWNYSFFLDLEGHISDQNVKALFEELKEIDVEVKYLGSYPRTLS